RQRLRSLDHQLATLETELHACGDRGVPIVPQDCVSGAAAG
ncbi:MAG: MerR family transcriptional regulator, partial [Burkholderiaceae bacterium]|nr:MerR family transcriptional regulator [Burkholderiaceae bacterium]